MKLATQVDHLATAKQQKPVLRYVGKFLRVVHNLREILHCGHDGRNQKLYAARAFETGTTRGGSFKKAASIDCTGEDLNDNNAKQRKQKHKDCPNHKLQNLPDTFPY